MRESTAPAGESPVRKKVRFMTEHGAGGARAITGEQVEDYKLDETNQGGHLERLCSKVQTWTRQQPRRRWSACWPTELCAKLPEQKALR